ncbi:hypothetical protein [Enterococcus innesii]|uniref:hypothetical protein n=1 Tax=Enterococcus innesii TaxID=2839759 RepID=UPI002DBC6BCB|nr:hypothetical protein [Enterococcus innesii]MEB5950632.1 hypothetical protein [Enterococcus innesii]
MKYKSLQIVATLSYGGGRGFYEIAPITMSYERLEHKKLFFRDCRDKGLIKRYDHSKDLLVFLNTEEGNIWFDENSRNFVW